MQDPEIHIDTPDGPIYFYDLMFLPLNGNGEYLPFERNVNHPDELVYQDVDAEYIYTYLITLRDERFITLETDTIINDNFQLYPNPFVSDFTLQFDSSTINQLQIKDLNGRSIDFEINGYTLTPLNCSKGVYFLSFEANGKLFTQKIVKQ